MVLYKEDLRKIGHTQFRGDNGCLHIISSVEVSNIEEILLRNILLLFGDYKIVAHEDFVWENGEVDIEFTTNLPVDEHINP